MYGRQRGLTVAENPDRAVAEIPAVRPSDGRPQYMARALLKDAEASLTNGDLRIVMVMKPLFLR